MKYIITCLFVIAAFPLVAQQTDTVYLKNKPKEFSHDIVTDRPPQALYFGIGGAGLLFSANYDRRFANKLNGLGFSTGAGFYIGSDITILTIPASLNYLIGRQNHFLEIAAGVTFVTGSVTLFDDDKSSSGSGFIGSLNFGYRYQPAHGGFFARVGASPLFALSGGGGYITSGYLGLGYCF